jgi:hypothetical protein
MQDYQLRVCVSCGGAFVQSTNQPFPTCNKCREEKENSMSRFIEARRLLRVSLRKFALRIV